MPEDISTFWNEEAFNGQKIREYSKKEGVNPRDFEKEIWEYDTLYLFTQYPKLDLYLRGGTCVQSYLPYNYQRFSVDLDFNIRIKERDPESVSDSIQKLNEILTSKGLIKGVSKDIEHGKFYPLHYDKNTGTLSFARVFQSRTTSRRIKLVYAKDLKNKKMLKGIFNHILIQINVKHELYALEWSKDEIKLRIQRYSEYQKELKFKRLSIGDLLADKIIALSNREEFKDLYDLSMLTDILTEKDLDVCDRKLDKILMKGKPEMVSKCKKVVEESLENKIHLRYIHTLPRSVVPVVSDRIFYARLLDILERIG